MNLIAAVMLSLVPHSSPPVTTVAIDVTGIRTFGSPPLRFVIEGNRCATERVSPDPTRTFDVEACSTWPGYVEVKWTLHDGSQYLKRRTLGVNLHGGRFDAGIEHVIAVNVRVE